MEKSKNTKQNKKDFKRQNLLQIFIDVLSRIDHIAVQRLYHIMI